VDHAGVGRLPCDFERLFIAGTGPVDSRRSLLDMTEVDERCGPRPEVAVRGFLKLESYA
jgi:hypothetical protein